jgi:hypothetical protein
MPTTHQSSLLAAVDARILRSRPLVRAPIWIYEARAGAMLGSRLPMIEHIGRTSGARRYAPTPATARILTQPQADRALDSYISRRPRAWERFKPVLEKTLGSADHRDRHAVTDRRAAARLTPAPSPSAPRRWPKRTPLE